MKPALKPSAPGMTVDEFLVWEDGTDTRYELIGGEPFAMAPPAVAHGAIVINLGVAIQTRLRPPCRVYGEAGIQWPDRDDTWYQADLAVSCQIPAAGDRMVPPPKVIIEVLSPSTASFDRGTKVTDYRTLSSVQEIVLVSSDAIRVELWRRSGPRWLVEERVGPDAVLSLDSIGVEVPLAALYDGVVLEERGP